MLEINYDEIDEPIRELVFKLNELSGIETTCSCCGHGKQPCRIWFNALTWESFHSFLFECLDTFTKWRVYVCNDDVNRDPYDSYKFCLECEDQHLLDLCISNLVKSIDRYLSSYR